MHEIVSASEMAMGRGAVHAGIVDAARLLVPTAFLVLIGFTPLSVFADEDVVEQVPMVVSTTRLVSNGKQVGGGFGGVLLSAPALDLQSQGLPGGQSDLSIRGSSFSGAGISLQGLAIANAQTEHWQADLPIASALLGQPRILTGFEQTAGGSGYLVGSVDLSILPAGNRRLVSGGVSEHDSYWGEWLAQQQRAVGSTSIGIGGFAGGGSIQSVDSQGNDQDYLLAGGQLQLRNRKGDQTDILLGHQVKRLGVRGFYGVTTEWDGDEETEDTLFLVSTRRERPCGDVRASGYYREFQDDYQLFWSLPGRFENRHRLQTLGGMLDGRWRPLADYWLDWRLATRNERIRSSALGRFDRQQFSLAALPGWHHGRWAYQAGGIFEIFSESADAGLPQVSVTYFAGQGVSVQLAYSESVREPSYTELNYESPASLGNAGLKNQQSATTELVVRGVLLEGVVWELGGFRRETSDTVDWIRPDADATRWEARNIGRVTTHGVEAGMRWTHSGGSYVSVHYLGLDKAEVGELYASRYALDYAQHRLRVQALAAIGSRVTIGCDQTLRRQEEHPLRKSGGRTQVDGSIQVNLLLVTEPQVYVWLALDNMWDDDFEVFPGQDTIAARRYSGGIRMEW